MEVISGNVNNIQSGLNPKAPMFVPEAYKTVQDFSEEWWDLVHSSPWYQDYWFTNRFEDPQIYDFALSHINNTNTINNVPLFDTTPVKFKEEAEEERVYSKDLIKLGALKWRNMRILAETPKFPNKAPKIVNKKMIPRPIQQPR